VRHVEELYGEGRSFFCFNLNLICWPISLCSLLLSAMAGVEGGEAVNIRTCPVAVRWLCVGLDVVRLVRQVVAHFVAM